MAPMTVYRSKSFQWLESLMESVISLLQGSLSCSLCFLSAYLPFLRRDMHSPQSLCICCSVFWHACPPDVCVATCIRPSLVTSPKLQPPSPPYPSPSVLCISLALITIAFIFSSAISSIPSGQEYFCFAC